MTKQRDTNGCERRRFGASPRWLLLLALTWTTGCAALHPIKGVPASYLPPEYIGPSRDGLRPINPMLLTRSRPPEHLVDAGDVLSIYIPSVLGMKTAGLDAVGDTPPINYPTDPEMPPTVGYPISIRGDGTISLPQIPPLVVRGMTVAQVEQAIRHAYTTPKQIINVDSQRIVVSLQRMREHRVLVVREDSSLVSASTSGVGTVNLGNTRRGTARIVSLKAYENDVLHALARVQGADGLPGLDAEGAIYVIRRQPQNPMGMFGPAGCGPHMPLLGASSQMSGSPLAIRTASTSQPVIRYQSPSGNYRSQPSAVYAGHSFAAPTAAMNSAGRYGAAPYLPGPQSLPMSPPVAAPRYSANPAALAPTNSALGGVMPPSPTNWNRVVPAAAQVPASGPYGQAPVQLVQGVQGDMYSLPPQAMPNGPQLAPAGAMPVYPYGGAAIPPVRPSMMQPAPMMMSNPQPNPYAAPAMPQMPMPSNGAWGVDALPTDDYFNSMMVGGLDGTIDGPNVIRIPIRVGPGETPHISEQDITLEDGDIVFIEARGSEVFYTGGLLGGGQYTLPRDYDLRALEALSIAQSQGGRGGSSKSSGGLSALNQDVTISASKLIVVRKLADGTSVPIEVDLNRAKRDMTGRENIIIQPGDYLYLQYSCIEAVGAFFERHLLEGALFGLATAQFNSTGN